VVSPSYDIITDFREHGGHVTSGPFVDKPLLLLTTIGARSHARRTSPLIYSRDGDRYVIVASKGGAPHNPAWYHNLLANPVVEIEVEGTQLLARAIVADPADRRRLYDQQIAILPGFAEYERRTSRQIPVVLLEPIPGPEGTASS
jgi:deazaflavin-dependent oxidoreductase (nitroreductase family)